MEETTIEMRTVDPDFEVTQEIPVVGDTIGMPVVKPLPPHLIQDPILTMGAPEPHQVCLFDDFFGRQPRFRPPKPSRPPYVLPQYRPARTHRIPRQDKVLIGLAATVVLMGMTTYGLVRAGWRADIPQESRPAAQALGMSSPPAAHAPGQPGPSRVPVPSRSPRRARSVPRAPGVSSVPVLPMTARSRPLRTAPRAVPSWASPSPSVSPASVPAPSVRPGRGTHTGSPAVSPLPPSVSPDGSASPTGTDSPSPQDSSTPSPSSSPSPSSPPSP